MKRIAVLASGGGSNLQALIDAQERGFFDGKIELVFSNRADAQALQRATRHGIETLCLESRGYAGPREKYDAELLAALVAKKIDLVCLAGYMRIFTPLLVRAFRDRMMNVHPALLPKFGGVGFYGHHVHEAVLRSGEKESGATVHFVDEGTDTGPILLQGRVPVLPGDTPETLAARVLPVEHALYPEAVRLFCLDAIQRIDGKVVLRRVEG